MIVVPDPSRGEVPDFIEIFPVVLAKPFISYGSVKTFDVSVLLRLAWLNVLQCNACLLCPHLNDATDVFRAVVAPNDQWLASPFNDLV